MDDPLQVIKRMFGYKTIADILSIAVYCFGLFNTLLAIFLVICPNILSLSTRAASHVFFLKVLFSLLQVSRLSNSVSNPVSFPVSNSVLNQF